MFITSQAHRSASSSLISLPGQAHWKVVELALNVPWFIVRFTETEWDRRAVPAQYFSITRSLLVDSIRTVEQMIDSTSNEQVKFESVEIVLPGYMNGTKDWKVEMLESVHPATHPAADNFSVDVFVTSDGRRFFDRMLEIPIDELVHGETRFKAPTNPSGSE